MPHTLLPPSHPALIAVVEDDPGLCTDLVDYLGMRGYVARGFHSAEAFFQAWPAVRFDLLLLDVALPGDSGLDVARRVRAQDPAGIVMLTALQAEDDQLAGLGAGADAYLSKHSSLDVIEATCRNLLRRLPPGGARLVTAVPPPVWRLNTARWTLRAPNGEEVGLTQVECALLAALFAAPGRAVERAELLQRLDRPDTLSNLRNLDNAASRLRRKVRQACGLPLPLRASYGKGYSFSGDCAETA